MLQDGVTANAVSGYMLPKANWAQFVDNLLKAGLVFEASLSTNKAKALQNRDHINLTAFNILQEMNIAVYARSGQIASASDVMRGPVFGLTSVSQVKDQRLKRAHMLSITPDLVSDTEAWGFKSLQQRYPPKKVGHPDSILDDQDVPTKTIFLICKSLFRGYYFFLRIHQHPYFTILLHLSTKFCSHPALRTHISPTKLIIASQIVSLRTMFSSSTLLKSVRIAVHWYASPLNLIVFVSQQ
jgi:hypothetical protein